MSTHSIDVLRVNEILPHENADSLEIIMAFDYPCIVRKGQFSVGDLFCFIHPDTLIDCRKEAFSFLIGKANTEGKLRIRSMRLRGLRSYGLAIPAPEFAKEGDNLWEHFGAEQYEPPAPRSQHGGGQLNGGCQESPPSIPGGVPVYDLENLKKFSKSLKDGEEVIFTVKVHGSNFRAVYHDGDLFVGSRTTWKMRPGKPLPAILLEDGSVVERSAPDCTWWDAVLQNPWIESWCHKNPDAVICGEVFGPSVQGEKFAYGKTGKNVGVVIFDVFKNGKWVDNIDLHTLPEFEELQKVTVLHKGPFDKELLKALAEAPETFGYGQGATDQIREGVVVKPFRERHDMACGRVALKFISDQYLDKT